MAIPRGEAGIRQRQEDIRQSLRGEGQPLSSFTTAFFGTPNEAAKVRHNQQQFLRGALLDEAQTVTAENRRRFGDALGFMQEQFAANTQRSLTDEDIDLFMGREADRLTQGALDDMAFLREGLGAAGITGGGLAAGLGADIELGRLGQLTEAARGLRGMQIQSDIQDSLRNIQAYQQLGNFMATPEDETMMATLAEVLGLDITMEGLERAEQQSSRLAEAQRDAGLMQGIGGLASGVLGLFG